MADLEALLAAIYAHPDDDARRSVYADALLEAGDPRGELIALQLRQVRDARTQALLDRYSATWLGPLAAIVMASEWKRGFPEAVTLDVFKSELVPALATRQDWTTIRSVELSGVPRRHRRFGPRQRAVVHALAKSPGWAGRKFRPSLTEIEASIENGTDGSR